MPSHSPTTEELLKHAEDLMRQDWAYLKDFNAALDQLQKKQEKFEAEHPFRVSLFIAQLAAPLLLNSL